MYKLIIAEDELLENTYITNYIKREFSDKIEICSVCNDGQSACEDAEKYNPHIVFLDIQMPIMNGLDAAQIIKKNNPNTEILIISAYGLFEYAQRAIDLGVTNYLLKPYLDEDLNFAINKIFKKLDERKKLLSKKIVPENYDFIAPKDTSPYAKLATDYIMEHFSEELTLNSVADALNVSSGHLGKCFKQSKNLNFNEFLVKVRIEKSKKLLSSGAPTVYAVAEEVGFKDSNYFNKCFKKEVGITPKEFLVLSLNKNDLISNT